MTKKHTPKKLYNTTKMTHEQWLEARVKGIGGSDVAVIFGLNKYKGAYQLFLEKTGQFKIELEENEAMYFGKELEDFIAVQFAKKNPDFIVRRNNFLLQHPEFEFMLANLDREVINEAGERGVLEIKTASEWLLNDWTGEEVPEAYMLQVQHYLAVTGYTFGKLAVLIGGNKYKQYHIDRDEEIIELLIEQETKFWNDSVIGGQAPELDGLSGTKDLLNAMFPANETDPESVLQLPFEADMIIQELEDLKFDKKNLESQIQEKENKLSIMLGDIEQGQTDEFIVTWKGQQRTAFDSTTFKAENPELAEQYMKTSWTKKSLKFKPKKGKK